MTTTNDKSTGAVLPEAAVAQWKEKLFQRYRNQKGTYRDLPTIAAEMLAAETELARSIDALTSIPCLAGRSFGGM